MVSKPERTYSTREVAQRLGVSVQTIQRWVDAGQLRAWKTVGGHRRIDLASAEALVRRSGGGPSMAVTAAQPAATSPYVLLLDSDEIHCQSLAREVGAALPSARVEQVSNAFSALLSMGARMPDIFIVDLSLVGVDGPAMLNHLTSRAAGGPTRTLALLAALDHPLPPGVIALRKPVDMGLLHRALRGSAAVGVS